MLKMVVNAVLLGLLFALLSALLVVVNFLLLLNIILVAPFSQPLFRLVAAEIVTAWLAIGKLYMQYVLKTTHTIHADSRLKEVKSAIIIANHQSMVDVVAFNQLAAKFNRQQDLVFLAKNTFKYVPLVGWGAYLTGTNVYLQRNWTQDKSKLRDFFGKLLSSKHLFWLMFYPEGTRLTDKSLAASQAFNRQQHRPHFDRVLSPRSKGFIAATQTLRPVISAVIDVTICYSHRPPLFSHILRGTKMSIDVHAKVFPIADLPLDDDGLREWLFDLFKEKDKLLSASSSS